MVLGELAQCPGNRDGVAGRAVLSLTHKGHRCGSDEQVLEVEAQFLDREPHQGVLVDLVLAACIAQRTSQLGEGGHVQATVFGQDNRLGRRQPLTNLVDDGDLPGPGFVDVCHARSPPQCWSC